MSYGDNEDNRPLPGALPCPFCGGSNIATYAGSTFRWRYAACNECSAQASEVRIETISLPRDKAIEVADRELLAAWNTRAPRPEVDANLVAEINTVWIHGCCQGHGEPVDDVATLTKRVRWIGSQLDCAQTNFRVTNAAYCKLDEETRALRSPQKPTALNPKAAWPFPEPRDTINGATSKVGGGTEHG